MLNIKCFHCGKSFALNTDVVAAWLEEEKEKKPTHYSAQCHFCRRVVKVPINQIRRSLPREEEAETQ
jgi:phage terminase large subunit GpA-like protein